MNLHFSQTTLRIIITKSIASMSIFIVFFLVILTPSVVADIRHIKLTTDFRRRILLEQFRFNENGHVSISVESATLGSVRNLSRLAFCILSEADRRSWCPYENPPCLPDRDRVRVLFDFTQLVPPQNSFNQSYAVTLPSNHYLYFANCLPDSPVTMSVTTEMYNLNDGHRDYLPVGQTQLPRLYLALAAGYLVLLTVWAAITAANRKTRHFRTHLLMGGLILTKALSLICDAVNQRYINVTGTSHGWDVVFCILQLIRGILLCGVIASINTNCTIIRPPEKQTYVAIFITTSLLLDVIFYLGYRMGLKNRPNTARGESWLFAIMFYRWSLYILTFAVFLFVYESFRSSGTGEIIGRKLLDLSERKLMLVVIFWGPRLMLALMDFVDRWFSENRWVGLLLDEVAVLVVYVLVFYKFWVGIRYGIIFIFNIIADVVEDEEADV